MRPYQQQFIEFCLQQDVLKFGEFTLKSGRISPYFFNAGLFKTGAALAKLGQFYAQAIIETDANFDMLFGPAYKGIPLVSSVAIALSEQYGQDYPYAFNRKEAKDHGEGGMIVGSALQGRVLIIDDVITAGTAIRHSLELIRQADATLAGVCVALDRQERGQGQLSAIQEIEQTNNITVTAIICLRDLIEFLAQDKVYKKQLQQVSDYQEKYAV